MVTNEPGSGFSARFVGYLIARIEAEKAKKEDWKKACNQAWEDTLAAEARANELRQGLCQLLAVNLDKPEALLDAVQNELEDGSERIAQLGAELEGQRHDKEVAERAFEAEKARADRLEGAHGELVAARGELIREAKTIAGQRERIAELEAEVAGRRQEIFEMKEILNRGSGLLMDAALDKDLHTKDERIAALERARRDLKALLTDRYTRIVELEKRIAALEAALNQLVHHVESETCLHEETHRGGAIWEICGSCGVQWADDKGGRPEFAWPSAVTNAHEVLSGEGGA